MFNFQGKSYKNIVWDFNGTILDDFSICFNIINDLLKDRNMNLISESFYQQHFELPVKPFYEKAGFDFSKEDFSSICDEWITKYDDFFHSCTMQNFIKDCFHMFDSRNARQYVISACEERRLNESLKRLDVSKLFIEIYGTRSIEGISKLDLAHKFLDDHKAKPEETIVVGDTDHDKELALEIGCDCILYYSGHQSKERLKDTGLPVIDCYSEIL